MIRLQFLTLRQWKKRPARAVLTVFSVAIAVACVLGSSLTRSMVEQAFQRLSETLDGPPAIELVAAEGGRFEQGRLSSLPATSDVQAVVPLLYRATLVRAAGKKARSLAVGLDPGCSEPWNRLRLTAGRRCQSDGEAVVDVGYAQFLGLKLGDRMTILGRRGPRPATVVGLIPSDNLRDLRQGATLLLTLRHAQTIFGLEGQIDRARLMLSAGASPKRAQQAVASGLPGDLIVQPPGGGGSGIEEMLRSTQLALDFAAALSLVMAIFIVLNTLRMNFHERRRELAVLRALGATARQISRLLLSEGLTVGLLGALLGIPLGWLVALALTYAMRGLLEYAVPTPELHPAMMAFAVAVGEVAVLVAVYWTLRQARHITPVEGMREGEPHPRERIPVRNVVTALVGWTAASVLLVAVRYEVVASVYAIPVGLLMLGSYLALLPAVVGPVVRGATRLVGGYSVVLGMLAGQQLLRRPVRTGLTTGVLVVAIASSLGLGNAITNHVRDVRDWYGRTMSGDFFLENVATESPAVAAEEGTTLQDAVRQLPGVRGVTAVRFLHARVGATPAVCVIRDFPEGVQWPWSSAAQSEQELRAELAAGKALMSSVLAHRLNVGPNDEVLLQLGGRTQRITVGAIVSDYFFGGLSLFLDSQTARRLAVLPAPDLYLVHCGPRGADDLPEQLRQLAQQNGLALQSFSEFRASVDRTLNGIVGSLWAVIATGFIVAGFGVANTLTMSVLEQTREFGLLRVVGMTRGQVFRLVCGEALLLALLGLLFGCLSGILTAWTIHWCSEPLMGRTVPFEISLAQVAATMGVCLAVALTAAFFPARRACALRMTEAIAYE